MLPLDSASQPKSQISSAPEPVEISSPVPLSRKINRLLIDSVLAWIDHRASSKGAALAFYTLFSMTPILVLAIAVAGYFFGAEAAEGRVIYQIQGLVGPNGAMAIQALLAAAQDPATGAMATVVAGVLLLVGATSVFAELKGSLDELWGVGEPRHSAVIALIRTRLMSFGLVLVLAFLLMASLVISTALRLLQNFTIAGFSILPTPIALFSALVPFAIIVSLCTVIYKTLPNAPLSWKDAWVGALFTATLFNLGKYAIGLYLGHTAITSSFGAAGSVIALLLWVYYSAQIFFFGAEFTRQYALWFGSLQDERLRLLPMGNGD